MDVFGVDEHLIDDYRSFTSEMRGSNSMSMS